MPETFKGTIFLLALVTNASLMPVEELPLASWQTALGLGFLSSVFDNIPLTALALKQGGYDWGFLAYAVGFGGSMIWFGSSAGVALSNMYPEAKSVGRWLRHGWYVAVAYVVGFFVMLAILGWNPDAPHKKRVELPDSHNSHNTGGRVHELLLQWLTLVVFAMTIAAIVVNKLDATVAALLGVAVMIWMGTMTEVEAAQLVDWNVMAILVGIWIIAGYFGRTGVPSWLSVQSLKLSGGQAGAADPRAVDADRPPVDVHRQRGLHPDDGAGRAAARARARHSGDAAGADDRLLRQLHGHRAAARRPAAADAAQRRRRRVLRLHLAARAAVVVPDPDGDVRHHAGVHVLLRLPPHRQADGGRRRQHQVRHPGPDCSPSIAVGMFLLTVFAMAMREYLGVKLGFIALTGAVITGADHRDHGRQAQGSAELRAHRAGARLARGVLLHRAVRAGRRPREDAHPRHAGELRCKPIFAQNYALGATLLYWVTIPIVGIVEHDAYILTFLNTIKELGTQGIPPWPLWWMVLWSGTLGSNLTVAGAPALYVALRIAEKEEDRKVSLREFLSWSLPFCLVSSFVCYVFAMLIWVLPYAK